MQLFGSLNSWWLSWAHLAPSLADLVPKWAPIKCPKMLKKGTKNYPMFNFFDFCSTWVLINIRKFKVQFWSPKWTRVFAQNSKTIYKRSQDEPKRAIMSFKESFQTPQKTSSFYTFLGPEASQESLKKTQEPPKKHPKSSKGPCKKLPKKIPKTASMVKNALSRRSHLEPLLGPRFGDFFCSFLSSLLI